MRIECKMRSRLKMCAAVMVAMTMIAGLARGDSVDDAEAKRRGVSVEMVQLERARTRIAELEKQVADLQAQLKAPQDKPATQAAVATTQKKAFVPVNTFTKRAQGANIANARKIDAAIAAYLKTHDVSDEMASAMYAGQPKPGMTEEQVKTFGSADPPKVETLNGKSVLFYAGNQAGLYTLVINIKGVIVSVENSAGNSSVGEVGGYIQNIGGQTPGK